MHIRRLTDMLHSIKPVNSSSWKDDEDIIYACVDKGVPLEPIKEIITAMGIEVTGEGTHAGSQAIICKPKDGIQT